MLHNHQSKEYPQSGTSKTLTLFSTPKILPSIGSTVGQGGPTSTNVGHKGLVKFLSQCEMEDRRKNRLCFWFVAKYTPGHKCTKPQLYQLIVKSESDVESKAKNP